MAIRHMSIKLHAFFGIIKISFNDFPNNVSINISYFLLCPKEISCGIPVPFLRVTKKNASFWRRFLKFDLFSAFIANTALSLIRIVEYTLLNAPFPITFIGLYFLKIYKISNIFSRKKDYCFRKKNNIIFFQKTIIKTCGDIFFVKYIIIKYDDLKKYIF